MAYIFMKIDNITGESQDTNHKEWIELLSVSQGIMAASTVGTGGGAGGGKPSVSAVTIVTEIGKHTAEFKKAVLAGTHFPKIEIHCCKPTGDASQSQVYEKIVIERAYFENNSGSTGGPQGTESLTVNGEKFTWEYSGQDGSGALTTSGEFGYDSKLGEVF